MPATITLGIDYGASNIGIALVRNGNSRNEVLFAGTLSIDNNLLKGLSENRAAIRRTRRNRKTKKRRLYELHQSLVSAGIHGEIVGQIVRFGRKRGWISLFGGDAPENDDTADNADAIAYRFSREAFFIALEEQLELLIPDGTLRAIALKICERVLNRPGDRGLEPRTIRIENRGVSRCAWEGCDSVTPRRSNAMRDALSQQLYTVLQASVKDDGAVRTVIDSAIASLEELAKRLQAADRGERKKEQASLRKKARGILKDLGAKLFRTDDPPERRKEAWKKIQDGTLRLMESGDGRNRYCREHSRLYVEAVIASKPIPFKKTIAESDIVSRREQIAYAKLWRYIEARVLTLAPEGIDRVVVERTAIDLLAGKFKNIQKATDKFKEEMYQQGPMYGFGSVLEMLRAEFGGLCAYCGKPSGNLVQRDHIMPQSEFFFDGYLNILPACPDCNSNVKRAGLMSDTCGHVHEEAYKAYCDYLGTKFRNKPMHELHARKKGLLNLMKDPERAWEAERYLNMIAGEYAATVQANRGWRPFARYLCMKIEGTQQRPVSLYARSGRHTAMYRGICCPDFNKLEEKTMRNGRPFNHAVDAILLASHLPSPYLLETRAVNWGNVKRWTMDVRNKAPLNNGAGIPAVPDQADLVPGFEEVEDGYIFANLMLAWNWKDRATLKQDPYGWDDAIEKPLKRKAADVLYVELVKGTGEDAKKIIGNIRHPGLRKALDEAFAMSGKAGAADALKFWLRASVRNSLHASAFSGNPGDTARREILARFANGEDMPIPSIIGVSCVSETPAGRVDLERANPHTGRTIHRYQTDPTNKGLIVAYPKKKDGTPNLSKPCLAYIRQNDRLEVKGKIFLPLPSGLRDGQVLGRGESGFDWEHVESYLRQCGFAAFIVLKQGCVLCYNDGTTRFLRNFAPDYGFKPSLLLKNIVAVKRTPYSQGRNPLHVL